MPPARTGIAAASAALVEELSAEHAIDVFVDQSIIAARRQAGDAGSLRAAHDFLWLNQLDPYDLTVYQLGNSSSHDFLWPYLFRFPGLVVLHDVHLHHARGAALLWRGRVREYRDEFAANELDTPADLAELAVAGFDSHLYYSWPMTRLVTRASRLTAVHSPISAEWLRAAAPGALIEPIRLGHGERVMSDRAAAASARIRTRHQIPMDAVLFGLQGGLTPEKRLAQVLSAFAALLPYVPSARLLLAGEPAPHYDVRAAIARHGLGERVVVTGYVSGDESFTDYVAGCDVSLNLRWPTAREVSGPWLRAIAAGRPTITIDLAHTADVPALDPRTWTTPHDGSGREPVTVAIDILDEDHSLRLAMRRLAADASLRASLGRAAAEYWERQHSPQRMFDDYRRILARAQQASVPIVDLPRHLRSTGGERLETLLDALGLERDVWSKI